LAAAEAVVLAGTGPVGLRAAQLLAAEGARVRVGSRSLERAVQACDELRRTVPAGSQLAPFLTATRSELEAACSGVQLVIAAGAAGVELLPAELRTTLASLKVAIDLNAVPPVGITGIEVHDKAVIRDGVTCYGAIGVGGLKMKIHKAALGKLFESNDLVLDTAAIYKIGEALV
jgi:hypothetical protein